MGHAGSLTPCVRAAASVAMTVPLWGVIALAYHLAARLAYVLYIGLALRREDRTAYLARRHGPEGTRRHFRRSDTSYAVRRFKYAVRSEEHTSELQSQSNLVCRLLLA